MTCFPDHLGLQSQKVDLGHVSGVVQRTSNRLPSSTYAL